MYTRPLLLVCFLALPLAGAGCGTVRPGVEQPGRVAQQFPAPGVDVVMHDLRVDVDVGADGRIEETLVFAGRMTVERGRPYVNPQGLRQIDFTVRSWTASAYSKVLGQEIQYLLSEGIEQPVSTIIAERRDADFPATFTFRVIFDVRANNQTVFRQHQGRPEGRGFRVVPPTGDRATSPTIAAFEDARIVLEHPQLGRVQFIPRDCNDRQSETVRTL